MTEPGRRVRVALAAVLALVALGSATASVPHALASSKRDDDVAKIAPGFTLRVLRDRTGVGEAFAPRAVVDTAAGLFTLDFGGWVRNKGRLVRSNRDGSGSKVVFKALDRPHGMAIGPDGLLYVGESTRIFRFDPADPAGSRTTVVTLPSKPGDWKHPLTQFAWLADRSLLVNNGSRTNACSASKGKSACPEVQGALPAASILLVAPDSPKPSAVFARGLRNSMGIVVHPSGTIVQAENSRDAIDEADRKLSDVLLPHDELNVIARGADYGFPYCFDAKRNSPEFTPYNCAATTGPVIELPAHSAPLGLVYWTPKGGREQLVVSLHGYRDTGHRLVAFAVDAQGRPQGTPVELVRWKNEADVASEIPGPVGVSVARDNSLLIADDRRGVILELARS